MIQNFLNRNLQIVLELFVIVFIIHIKSVDSIKYFSINIARYLKCYTHIGITV